MNTVPDGKTNPTRNISKISLLKGVIQNRITTIGIIGLGIMVYKNNFEALTPLLLGPFFGTFLGTTTAKIYERTCNHIERFGHIDDRFFIKVMGNDVVDTAMGYCQLQGMYLAARKYKKEEEFFRLKKIYTNNLIPNF